jgi:transcriptional regulator with XRE-family HTH domain
MSHEDLLTPSQLALLAGLYGPGSVQTQADLQKIIGLRIRAAMDLNGFDGKVVAVQAGHKKGTQLSLWQSGERMPPAMQLILLAEICRVPLGYLLGIEDEPERNVSMAARTQIARMVQERVEAAVASVVDEVHAEMTNGLPVRDAWQRTLSGIQGLLAALAYTVDKDPDGFDELRGGSRIQAAAVALMRAVSLLDHRAGVSETVRAELRNLSDTICKNKQKS